MASDNTQNVEQEIASTQKIAVKQDPNFRTINVTGIYSVPTAMRFEIIVYSEQAEVAETLSSPQTVTHHTISRTIECRLIMDPITTKSIAQFLTSQVHQIEEQYGHILTSEELQQATARAQAGTKEKTNGVG